MSLSRWHDGKAQIARAEAVRELQRRFDRLFDREREERSERRGLEQRAVTTLGVLLVAAGLVVNAATGPSDGAQILSFGVAGFLALLAGFYLLLPLCGLHLQDANWLRPRVVLGAIRGDAELPSTPHVEALSEEKASAFAAYVEQLAEANRRAAVALRLSNVCLLLAFSVALLGLLS